MAGAVKNGLLQVHDPTGGGGTPVEITGPLGPNTSADSISVTLATDQSPIPVSIPGTVPVSSTTLATEATLEAARALLALIKAKTDNFDVALSTRTKPSDQQHAIIDSSALPSNAATENGGNLENIFNSLNGVTETLDVLLGLLNSIISLSSTGTTQAVSVQGTLNQDAVPIDVKLSATAAVIHTILDSQTAGLTLESTAASSNALLDTIDSSNTDIKNEVLTAITRLESILTALLPLINPTTGFEAGTSSGPLIQALVSDSEESYVAAELKPLSLTNDGRLRVSSSPSELEVDFFTAFSIIEENNLWDSPSAW
jgi:hypothetical protein